MSIKNYRELEAAVKGLPPLGVAVAAAADPEVIDSLMTARRLGCIGISYLAGDEAKIKKIIAELGDDLSAYEILPAANDAEAGRLAVEKVRQGQAKLLVKGLLKTELYLKAILDKETGIRQSSLLSNVSIFEMPSYHKFLAVSDNAILIQPTLDEKKAVIENTKPLWAALGITAPKVAVLAAVETVSAKMPATLDAAALVVMAQRGQIKGFVIDGPLAYDAAIDAEAAKTKGITQSPVCGDPDLLLVPNLETGNSLGKSFKFHGNAVWSGLVMGAKVPCVLNSRSDDRQNRLNSLMMARLIAERS